MRKPRLLDLYCYAGGAGMGYHRAGFEVTGVDIVAQAHYPFRSELADALEFLSHNVDWIREHFAAIHASPPCQRWVGWQNISAARGATNTHPDLVTPTRALLDAIGLPYIIENGENTPLIDPVTLCGSMFDLGVRRHRKFETNLPWKPAAPRVCRHTGAEVGVYGKLDGRRLFTRADGTELRNPSSLAQAQAAMGIDWMDWDELREAIPPAYTAYLGQFLLAAVSEAA